MYLMCDTKPSQSRNMFVVKKNPQYCWTFGLFYVEMLLQNKKQNLRSFITFFFTAAIVTDFLLSSPQKHLM